ncbi:MAG: hypothetical protein WCL04_03405 [Verrucomicrobiota bacterium]
MPPANAPIPLLLLLAPLFAFFELWQLVLAERYMGVKQYARNSGPHPRELGPGEGLALVCIVGILFNWFYMLGLVATKFSRLVAIVMLAVSLFGLTARRQFGERWWRRFGVRLGLVLLTFEGAIRLGLLGFLWREAWRRW